jgi:hypothetical protein
MCQDEPVTISTPSPRWAPALRVLILGDAEAAEMRDAVAAVRAAVPPPDVRAVREVREAGGLIEGEAWHPDLVLVLQEWPEQFTPGDVRQLWAWFPLARFVCAFGPWCDSDGRSRALWPLAVRVAAASAAERIGRELEWIAGRPEAGPPLPPTAGRDEVFESACRGAWPRSAAPVVAAVRSPDAALQGWLEELLRRSGCRIAAAAGDEVALLVWDADPWGPPRAEALQADRERLPQARVAALVGFPRHELGAELKQHGAAWVIPKLAAGPALREVLASLGAVYQTSSQASS